MTAILRKMFDKQAMEATKRNHTWAIYANPRNGKVHVSGCTECGFTRDEATEMYACQGGAAENHLLHKMGWERLEAVA